jgi:hypothetical protein
MFRNGRIGITDRKESGCPSTTTTEKKIGQFHETVLDYQWMPIDAAACHLHISHRFAHGIIKDEHRFHKVSARLVPKQLTGKHKCNH